MAVLNISGQADAVTAFQPKLVAFRDQMELRREVWDRISNKKRRAWITSDKDPLLSLAWQMHTYFSEWFEDSGEES